MSYARTQPRPAPKHGRHGPDYQAAVQAIRARAAAGEGCWFYGRDPHCRHPHIDLTLPHNNRWAFTAHHLTRLMDGGHPTPNPALMAPAHRGCNSRDGLQAQNDRRAGRPTTAPLQWVPQPRSRDW